MNYKLTQIIVNQTPISYYFKDNSALDTILFIHGYNSSSDFASGLYNIDNNFNIVTLNLPGSDYLAPPLQELGIDYFSEIIEEFITNHLQTENLILLGHSLGGGSVAAISQNPKVKQVIYLSPINPGMIQSNSWKQLYDFHYPPNQNLELEIKQAQYVQENQELEEIFDKLTLFVPLTKKYLLNDFYVTNTLPKQYEKSLNKNPLFIIGDSDVVIDTQCFVNFVEQSLKKPVIVLTNTQHSPIKENPIQFNNLLNSYIKFKKAKGIQTIIKH